jgi:DNA-binding NtrC family response regulator
MDDSPNQGRLLAVDDNSDSAELIARVARKCGYDVKMMADTRALRQTLDDWKPEVVTLDLCMPQEDGIALLSQLQESRFGGRLIISSGQDDWLRKAAGRLAALRGLNVADDMAKPVDLKALRQLLTNLRTGLRAA